MKNTIYMDFIIEEHFTVEDYGENGFALFCEGSFVTELETLDETEIYAEAVAYEAARRERGEMNGTGR